MRKKRLGFVFVLVPAYEQAIVQEGIGVKYWGQFSLLFKILSILSVGIESVSACRIDDVKRFKSG